MSALVASSTIRGSWLSVLSYPTISHGAHDKRSLEAFNDLERLYGVRARKSTKFRAWFTRVCIWVAVRLICFRARAQRNGTRHRNRERQEADYEYECDSCVEACNPELNQAKFRHGSFPSHIADRCRCRDRNRNGESGQFRVSMTTTTSAALMTTTRSGKRTST